MQRIEAYDVTGLEMLKELKDKGGHEHFHVILANVSQRLRVALCAYLGDDNLCGLGPAARLYQIQHNDNEIMWGCGKISGSLSIDDYGSMGTTSMRVSSSTSAKWAYGLLDDLHCGDRIILANRCTINRETAPLKMCFAGMLCALNFVESTVLNRARTTEEGGDAHLDSVDSARAQIEEITRLTRGKNSCTHPLSGLLVNMHTVLSGCACVGLYDPAEFLCALGSGEYVEVKEYESDETIYHSAQPNAGGGPPPPLIWLLQGEVAHHWTGQNEADELKVKPEEVETKVAAAVTSESIGVKELRCEADRARGGLGKASTTTGTKISITYNLQANDCMEMAKIPENSQGLHCVGPFQTSAAFFGGMSHMGSIVATARSKTAELSYEKFSKMLREEPSIASTLLIYMARNQVTKLPQQLANGPQPML